MPIRRRALVLATMLAPSLARAQAWRPDRPVRLIVPFAPGGSNDIVGRIVAETAGQILGQNIVVENRAGAGGVIGAEAVARAAPDGHTLLINSSHPTIPAIVARVPYQTIDDFAGVAIAGFSPYVVLVNPRLPVQTAPELLALLRANPGRYNLATTGKGSGVHLGGEMFRSLFKVDVEFVHYRGGGPSVAALVGGEIEIGIPTMASSIGQVRAGALRALAVTAERRTAALPNVPSAPEAGLPGLVHEECFPILAPAGTPAPALAALGAAFRAAIQQNAERLLEVAGVAARAGYETPDQVMAFIRDNAERNGAILRAAGVRPE